MIRPIMLYGYVSWAGDLNKKYLVRKLTKMQRLACLMISSAFPATPTGALEYCSTLLPFEKFLLAEAVRGSYSISVSGLWHVNPVITAEIIIVKRLIQGRNSVTRVRIEPRSCDQGRRENVTASLSATLPTF